MKRITLITIAACMFGIQICADAQGYGQGKRDPGQMVQMETERMVKELALDDETTKQFSEVYKAYLTERSAITREYRGTRGQRPQDFDDDSAAEKIVKDFERRQKMIEMQQKLLNLDIQYCEKFNKVLNPKQILKIYEKQNNGNRYQNGPDGGRPQARNYQGGRPGRNEWPESGWDNE